MRRFSQSRFGCLSLVVCVPPILVACVLSSTSTPGPAQQESAEAFTPTAWRDVLALPAKDPSASSTPPIPQMVTPPQSVTPPVGPPLGPAPYPKYTPQAEVDVALSMFGFAFQALAEHAKELDPRDRPHAYIVHVAVLKVLYQLLLLRQDPEVREAVEGTVKQILMATLGAPPKQTKNKR